MRNLWTPWRIKYILRAQSERDSAACVLCDKAGGPAQHDKENYVLYRGESCFVMLNLYPYTNGHMMIVPYRHEASLGRLDDKALYQLIAFTRASVAALARDLSPEGFNIGMNLGRIAGAGVADHLHMHVVPRWGGDTNFMSVLAETRMIPEKLEDTYERLAPILAQEIERGGDGGTCANPGSR